MDVNAWTRKSMPCYYTKYVGQPPWTLDTVCYVVHIIVPGEFKINSMNKVDVYAHPVAVASGSHGKILVFDLQPM